MKYLIMCEGSNELQIINILLEHDKLILGRDDLVDLRPFHARQLKSTAIQTALGLYPGNDIKILRVGDSLNDPLKILKDMEHRFVGVEKYCTKPELEMLLIIAEGLEAEYDKVKSKEKANAAADAMIIVLIFIGTISMTMWTSWWKLLRNINGQRNIMPRKDSWRIWWSRRIRNEKGRGLM